MSTHHVPDGERLLHQLSADCNCKPQQQLAIDGSTTDPDALVWAIVHQPISQARAEDETSAVRSADRGARA